MGYVLDIILIAIVAFCIIYGVKKGFFKSLMSLVSGVCALLIAFTFTPVFSQYINTNFIMNGVSAGLETTFLSIARTAENGADGEIGYDVSLLASSSQFTDMMNRAGFTDEDIRELFRISEGTAEDKIANFARIVADPIAKTVSDIIAFILIFLAALIVLKIITAIIGVFLKFPVLRTLDKTLGVVFGVVSAAFFAMVFVFMAESLTAALSTASPGTFSADMLEDSVIVEFIAKYNPLAFISAMIEGK